MVSLTSEEITPTISALVRVEKILYPRYGYTPGEWTIFSCSIIELYEGYSYNYPEIVVKGAPYSLTIGGVYRLKGAFEDNAKYGESYSINTFVENYEFKDVEELRYFLNGITSKELTERICSTLDDPITVLRNKDIKALSTVKGIKKKTAEKIIDKYIRTEALAKAYVCLSYYGVSIQTIDTLLYRFKNDADRLTATFMDNPYVLMYDMRGMGWHNTDAIAKKRGFTGDHPFRVQANILYQLKTYSEQGHTWIDPKTLLENTLTLLELSEESIPVFREALYTLQRQQKIWWNDEKTKIGLVRLQRIESKIASNLHRIACSSKPYPISKEEIENKLARMEEEQGWEFTDEQIDAIRTTVSNNVSIITGSAGVGKSSVVKGVLEILKGCSFAQCALSGRAAARLSEVTGHPGSTIHRLLGLVGDSIYYAEEELNKVTEDIVILDEVSMVGAEVFLALLEGIPDGHKLIMLGDPGQLESIGLCNVFKDMLESGVIAVSNLTKIHRQAAKSAIITESQKIRHEQPLIDYDWVGTETRGELQDLKLVVYTDSILSQDILLNEYRTLLANGVSPKDIQIVVPLKTRGLISTRVLNTLIQQEVNPNRGQKQIEVKVNSPSIILRVGDRVMVRENIYKVDPDDKNSISIFNGDFGYIVDITEDRMFVDFQQYGIVPIRNNRYYCLGLAYAMTCHKLQGSEAPYVIVGLDSSSHILQTREWLYTAITRAKKKCVLCAESHSLSNATSTSKVSTKQTMLKEYLQKEFEK